MSNTEKYCGDESAKFQKLTKVVTVISDKSVFALYSPHVGGTDWIGPLSAASGDSIKEHLKTIATTVSGMVAGCKDVDGDKTKQRMLGFSNVVIGSATLEATVHEGFGDALANHLPNYAGNTTTVYATVQDFFQNVFSTLDVQGMQNFKFPFDGQQYTFGGPAVNHECVAKTGEEIFALGNNCIVKKSAAVTVIPGNLDSNKGSAVVEEQVGPGAGRTDGAKSAMPDVQNTLAGTAVISDELKIALLSTVTKTECVSAAYSATMLPLLFAILCFAMFAQKMF